MEVNALVVLAILALLGSEVSSMNEEMAELAKMLRDNCVGETGVDVSVLAAVDGGADLPNDEKFKCYVKCTMETAGMLTEGTVDVEAVLALLPDEMRSKIEATLRACGTQRGKDDCDTAYLTQLCWQKANKADYFLV